MVEVRFSNLAEADLVEIDEFSVTQFAADVADSYMHGFDEDFALLARHPKVGESQPRLGKGIRCLVHRKHRIFYRVEGDEVTIVRIVHHARDTERGLQNL